MILVLSFVIFIDLPDLHQSIYSSSFFLVLVNAFNFPPFCSRKMYCSLNIDFYTAMHITVNFQRLLFFGTCVNYTELINLFSKVSKRIVLNSILDSWFLLLIDCRRNLVCIGFRWPQRQVFNAVSLRSMYFNLGVNSK